MEQNEQKELLLSKQIDDVSLISSKSSQHQSNKSIFNEQQTNQSLDVKHISQERLTNIEINHSKKFKNITKKLKKLKKKVKRAFIQKYIISEMNIASKSEGEQIETNILTKNDIISDLHQSKISNCQSHQQMQKHKRVNNLEKQIMKLSNYLNFGSKLKDSKEHKKLNKNFEHQNKTNSNSDQDTSQSEKFISYPSTETYFTEDLELLDQKYYQQKQYYSNQFYIIKQIYKLIQNKYQNLIIQDVHVQFGWAFRTLTRRYISGLNIYENLQKSKNIKISLTFSISQKIMAQTKIQKTLVIDLDETLVHCNEYPQLKSDFYIPVQVNQLTYQVGISIRPYAEEFLRNMAEYYEIIIFTASNEDYANQIINYLDPLGNLICGRLFREDCIKVEPGCHIKDLRILNRDLKDVVLIDNSAFSYAFQIDNGIPIIPYLDNKKDNELQHLESYLKTLIQYDDFRKVNTKLFNLQAIQNCNSIQQAIRYITSNSSSQIL